MRNQENTRDFILSFRETRDLEKYSDHLIKNPSFIPGVIQLCSNPQYPFAAYSSWLLVHVQLKAKELMDNHRESIIDQFLITQDHSAQRNLLNIINRSAFTLYKEGELVDYFFALLNDNEAKVALKVNAITALLPYLRLYPELKNEFQGTIHLLSRTITPSLRAAIKKANIYISKL